MTEDYKVIVYITFILIGILLFDFGFLSNNLMFVKIIFEIIYIGIILELIKIVLLEISIIKDVIDDIITSYIIIILIIITIWVLMIPNISLPMIFIGE